MKKSEHFGKWTFLASRAWVRLSNKGKIPTAFVTRAQAWNLRAFEFKKKIAAIGGDSSGAEEVDNINTNCLGFGNMPLPKNARMKANFNILSNKPDRFRCKTGFEKEKVDMGVFPFLFN